MMLVILIQRVTLVLIGCSCLNMRITKNYKCESTQYALKKSIKLTWMLDSRIFSRLNNNF